MRLPRPSTSEPPARSLCSTPDGDRCSLSGPGLSAVQVPEGVARVRQAPPPAGQPAQAVDGGQAEAVDQGGAAAGAPTAGQAEAGRHRGRLQQGLPQDGPDVGRGTGVW